MNTVSTLTTTTAFLKRRANQNNQHSIINVILIEANNLKAMDSNGLSDPYVKIKIDNQKYKSRVNLNT